MGFSAITEAWNGAVLASRFGVAGSLVVFGGGHNTYFGSDVHAFDLASRQWKRISDGYVTGRPEEYGEGALYPDSVYPDGSPLPPHNYGYVQYDPDGNDFLLLKGNTELGPNVKAAAIPHMLNLDSLAWRRGPRHPEAILNSGGFSTWDARRRLLWGHSGDDAGGNAFLAFRPDGRNADGTFGRWEPRYENKFAGVANHNAMQIHPDGDVIVVLVHARDGLFAINPEEPGAPAVQLAIAGRRPRIAEYAAIEYAPNLAQFVYYSACDGAEIYTIEPPASGGWSAVSSGGWAWHRFRVAPDSLDPIADALAKTRQAASPRHTFGRFRVATWGSRDVALLIRHIDTPVYACRLT